MIKEVPVVYCAMTQPCGKEALDEIGMTSFPKTSGSRGLHIFIPIRVGPSADQVLKFAQTFVARGAAADPYQY